MIREKSMSETVLSIKTCSFERNSARMDFPAKSRPIIERRSFSAVSASANSKKAYLQARGSFRQNKQVTYFKLVECLRSKFGGPGLGEKLASLHLRNELLDHIKSAILRNGRDVKTSFTKIGGAFFHF